MPEAVGAGWTAHLNSTYRGLSADRKGIEVRPLTVILGPNNGGKSQFLRSMVLLAACKRLLSPDERGYPLPLRGSLAQNLADMGFQDLAEELPDLIGPDRPIQLVWRAPFQDGRTFGQALADASEEMRRPMHRERSRDIQDGLPPVEYRLVLSYDSSTKEILVRSCVVRGLWEGLELRIQSKEVKGVESRQPKADWEFDLRAPPFPDFVTKFRYRGRTYDHRAIVENALRRSEGRIHQVLSQRWSRNWGLRILVRLAFSRLPSVIYLGPIRVRDDRTYSVASSQDTDVVGRLGEFTWVLLRELERGKSGSAAVVGGTNRAGHRTKQCAR